MEGYKLRYYKEYGLHKAIVRIEIYKKYDNVDFAPAPLEIGGVLAGSRLIMQGDQDNITSPIVKTSLELNLVDAPGTEYGRMTGPWEEFFTPDSTGYLVKLYIDNALEWSGYITPDSYEEDITTYGTVSIIARDNIGHLQDFLFEETGDSDGMISVDSIIDNAWSLIESQLKLDVPILNDGIVWPVCEGYIPIACMLNVEAFKGKNWYEVLETVLDTFGLALRYVGNNTYRICPLRSIAILDKDSQAEVVMRDAIFKADGHRTLQKACKAIVDSGKYETQTDVQSPLVKDSDFSGQESTYRYSLVADEAPSPVIFLGDAPVWPIKNKTTGRGWMNNDSTLFFDFTKYPGRYPPPYNKILESDDVMYIAANNIDDSQVTYSRRVLCIDQSIKMQFDEPVGLTDGRTPIMSYGQRLKLSVFRYSIKFETAGQVYYYDGSEWQKDSYTKLAKLIEDDISTPEIIIDIPLSGIQELDENIKSGILSFNIESIVYFSKVLSIRHITKGVYARIKSFAFVVKEAEKVAKSFDVKVEYDDKNNNLIERSSELLAPLQSYGLPGYVINGIYLPENGYPPARPWHWPGEDVKTELQVLVAQQILMYNSKPNNILTGSLIAEGEILRFPAIWKYGGRNHILVSGTMDLLTGHLEDVKLMEYVDWKDLYPDDHYFMTETSDQILTEENTKVIIGK